MRLEKRFNRKNVMFISSMLILLLLNSLNNQSIINSRFNSIKSDPGIIDNTASINNIQVPIISLDVAVKDSYAYLIGDYYFRYYNLEKTIPEFEGFLNDPYTTNKTFDATLNQIEIQDNYMYILGDYGYQSPVAVFYVAEMINSTTIDLLGSHMFNTSNDLIIAYYLHDLVIEDNYAFIGTTWYNTSYTDPCVFLTTIIDLSNKSNPVEIGNYIDSGFCTNIFVKNDELFLTVSTQKLYNMTDNSYYYIGENKLVILDISNKPQPTKIHQLNLSFRPCSVTTKNNYLYLSYLDSGFEIYDIDDVFNPVLIFSSNKKSRKIVIEGNLAYILEEEKLITFDISKANNPKKLGEKKVRFRGENGMFHDFIVEDNLVLAVRQVQFYGTFIIFDCSNIKNPKIIYPAVDDDALRYELSIIIFGYVISPVIIVMLLILVTRLLFLKRKKKHAINEIGV